MSFPCRRAPRCPFMDQARKSLLQAAGHRPRRVRPVYHPSPGRVGGGAEIRVSRSAFPLGQITDPDLILSYTSPLEVQCRKGPFDTRSRHHRHASSACTCNDLSAALCTLGLCRRRRAAPMRTVLEQRIFDLFVKRAHSSRGYLYICRECSWVLRPQTSHLAVHLALADASTQCQLIQHALPALGSAYS